MNLFAELKRRKVIRVAVVYAATAFAVLQAADIMLPRLAVPDWAMTLIVLLAVLGFPLALVLAWALEVTPEGIRRTDPGDTAPAPPALGKRTVLAAGLLVAVGIGLGAGWFLRPATTPATIMATSPATSPATTPDAPDTTTPGMASPRAERSIAVLPFVNLSPNEEDRYFGEGLAEELLNALTRIPELKVAARTSAFAFGGQNVDLREVGRSLGVDHVLEGSVRRSGDQLRITAQLIRVSDGFHLWSETFDRELTDVFAVQDEIVRELSRQLQVRLRVGAGTGIAQPGQIDPRAYQQYLQGLYAWGRRGEPGFRPRAHAAFALATEIDPAFAEAWAAKGMSLVLSNPLELGLPNAVFQETAREALARALELDPDSPRTRAVLAIAATQGVVDLAAAEAHLERALALGPNQALSHYAAAFVHEAGGDLASELRAYDRAVMLDPLNAVVARQRALALARAGRCQEAQEPFMRCLDSDCERPDVTKGAWLAAVLMCGSDADVAAVQQHYAAGQESRLRTLVLAATSSPPGQKRDLGPLQEVAHGLNATTLLALGYAQHGEDEQAIDMLFEAYRDDVIFDFFLDRLFLYPGRFELPERILRHPRYHELWAQPGLREMAEQRRANGQLAGLPLPDPGTPAKTAP